MKFTHLFAAAVLAFGFVACGGDEAEEGPEQIEPRVEPQQAPAAAAEPAAAPDIIDGVQVIMVNVQDTGYFPSRIKLKAGVPAKIIFDQHGTTACAWDVKSPELGIELTKLPADTKTEVTFTPEKGGTYAFTCGMDMLRGAIIVEDSEA